MSRRSGLSATVRFCWRIIEIRWRNWFYVSCLDRQTWWAYTMRTSGRIVFHRPTAACTYLFIFHRFIKSGGSRWQNDDKYLHILPVWICQKEERSVFKSLPVPSCLTKMDWGEGGTLVLTSFFFLSRKDSAIPEWIRFHSFFLLAFSHWERGGQRGRKWATLSWWIEDGASFMEPFQ